MGKVTTPTQSELQRRFGDRVREIRKIQEVSQEQLALDADLDRSFVGQVERGERNISLLNIHRIADALGVSPAVLFETARPRK